MVHGKKWRLLVAMGFGLALGLVLSAFWPDTPLHAVSTDRADTFAMATGPVDSEVEAVYFLDFLTGDLGAMVLGRQPGTWAGFFRRNVAADLAIDPQKNPKYMMVTGITGLRRFGGSREQWSGASCYVAEITSGKVAAYSIRWSPSMYAAGQMQTGALALVGATRFRQASDDGPEPGTPIRMPSK